VVKEKMSKSEASELTISKEISTLYIELNFLNETVNTLLDLTKEQAEAINAILKYLNEK